MNMHVSAADHPSAEPPADTPFTEQRPSALSAGVLATAIVGGGLAVTVGWIALLTWLAIDVFIQ